MICIGNFTGVKSHAKAKFAAMKNHDPVRENKGSSSVSEAARKQAKGAVCLIKVL